MKYKALKTIFIVLLSLISFSLFSYSQIPEDSFPIVTEQDINSGSWNTDYQDCSSCVYQETPNTQVYPDDYIINSVSMETCGDGSYVTRGSCFWCQTLGYTTAAGSCPASQPQTANQTIYTVGYQNYGTSVGQTIGTSYVYLPSAPTYRMTNWNNGGYSVGQIYAPTVQQPVVNTVQTAPYRMTNWNNGGSSVGQVYAPTVQQPVVNTVQAETYKMTNWNNGGSSVGQVYAKTCSQYYALQNGQCIQTQKLCQDGSVVNINDTCYKTCQNTPNKIPENQTCPNQTQVCWNGSVISVSQTCPTQTKTCQNGNVIPYNQNCTKTCPNGTVVGEDQICSNTWTHSVMTTQPTQVTANSCRFNAVAAIAGRVNTIGYFEYGETRALGLSTNQANIGNTNSINYSNDVRTLKENTLYYYRAVITNSNGTYRGDIESCRTFKTTTKTATPVVNKISNTKTIKKPVIVCQDISGNSSELSTGEKFVSIDITKKGNLSPGEEVEYIVSYKNTSSLNLENAKITVSVPKEMQYMGTDGRVEGGNVILDLNKIASKEQEVKVFVFKVDKNAAIGSSIITSAQVYYEMYDTDDNLISDENSNYNVSTISVLISDTDSTSGINTETWYSLLFKWILIILLFVLLVYLAKTIYKQITTRKHARRVEDLH
ncbi:MAG: Ig-like protein [Patescibacteria group bacterium]|nr:Ig-like protein [Patescibacteria group bacterium]